MHLIDPFRKMNSEDMDAVTSKCKKNTPNISQPDDRFRSLSNDGKENYRRKEQNPDIPQKTDKKYPKGNANKSQSPKDEKKHKREEIIQRKLESKTKIQIMKLSVTNFEGNETDLKNMLEKVSRNTFVIKKYWVNERDSNCIVEYPSANKMKDAMYAIQEHNRTSKMKILTTKEECKPENTTNLSQYLNKMIDEARNVLSDHQRKIETVRERIEQTGHKKKETLSMENDTRKQEEKKTLEFKLQEMKNQKSEFKNYLKYHIEILEKARDEKKVDTILKKTYSAFQIECNRLSNALPMYAKRTEISYLVNKNQVSVLLGETGSGKSTQIAQYLYQTGLANKGRIACTQPRKIAAISLATRVAQEMGTSVGQLVGYKVGMQAKMSHDTKILYMTDHMLLNECLKDENLSAYSCIIVDEAHERSIYTDLLLGMVKTCISKRQDLRVVVTSATIDPAVFVEYFGEKCAVLSVAGRMFPVDIVWPEDEFVNDKYEEVALEKTIQIHHTEERGDILTFLTSPLEVEKCCTSLTKTLSKEADFICLPLHGRLQANEQQKVFDPPPNGKMKIVFATNSAETSITIPGIKYVIDTGMAKEMQFDPKRSLNTLCVTNVTKSSADQRKGRAGRTEAGKCFRLYSAETYDKMETSSRPEILRVHLGQALLKLMELGVEPLKFDFVQAPPREMMNAAMDTLTSVGAVINDKITDLGKWIAKLPLDPKFGAFVYQAIKEDVGIEAMVLSACCATGGSIFYRSGTDKEKAKADKLKVRFCHEGGDLLTLLNVFREWHIQPEKEKGTWCSQNSINGKAIRGIRETVKEVLNVLIKDTGLNLKFKLNWPSDVDQKLQKMLFNTFKRNICRFLGHVKAGYLVVEKGRQVQQFPGSPLKMLGLQPDWIVMEQTLKTYSDFAVNVTAVKNEWVQEAVNEGRLQINLENINNQRVEQVAIFEVGDQIYKDFVGIRHSKLRELEEEIKLKNPNTIAFPLASKELGEIEVYAQQNCEHISTMIKDRIDNLRQQMQQVKSEQFLSSLNSGVRVVIGAGLSIDDVLMLDEYKSIIIYGNPEILETKTPKDMTEMFEKYGQIVKIEEFRKNKYKKDWGKITFGKKEDAENAVRMMTANHGISARPSIRFQKSNIHSFRSKLQWCRRPSRGFGFVRFKDPSVAQRSYLEPISVGGTLVKIKPSKSHDSEIHVGNLNQNVDEDVLRQGFEVALTLTPADIERVTVVRLKVNTDPLVFETFRRSINRKIAEYVLRGTYEVDLRTPKDTDFTYLAFVSFSNPEEGQAAFRAIDHSFELNNAVVTMKIDLTSSVMIPKLVYAKYATAVDSRVDKRTNTEGATMRKKQLKNGNVVLEIHTDSAETMIQVKSDILREINGSIMDLESNDDINRLFTRDGREQISRVMERTDTIILADERLFSIAIHGSESGKQSAIQSLTEYLNELKSGKLKKISLRGGDKPPEIMKELMLRYEFDLSKLKTETGLKFLELDLRSHIITVIGDTQSVDTCSRAVEEVIISIIEKRQITNLKPSQVRNCVICFCPIEDGEMYRLETCGHSYCKDCVKFQYKSAIQSNAFPITCSDDGCNVPWAWKDLIGMSYKVAVPVTELVKKATNAFVSQHKKEYRFCQTADCPLIYRVSEREKLFTCPDCEVRICTACHGQFHDGVTCKTIETMKKDDDGLKLWMQQNAQTAKYCPKCTTPIEKIAGCHHMTCLGCKSHICWMCLAYFGSSRECYGHMQTCHGSFV